MGCTLASSGYSVSPVTRCDGFKNNFWISLAPAEADGTVGDRASNQKVVPTSHKGTPYSLRTRLQERRNVRRDWVLDQYLPRHPPALRTPTHQVCRGKATFVTSAVSVAGRESAQASPGRVHVGLHSRERKLHCIG